MSEETSQSLQQSLRARLNFYQDLGVSLFYRQRTSAVLPDVDRRDVVQFDGPAAPPAVQVLDGVEISELHASVLPAIVPLQEASGSQTFHGASAEQLVENLAARHSNENVAASGPNELFSDSLRETIPKKLKVLDKPTGISFFDSIASKENDTIAGIRADLGECTRCKLHKTRNKIVFGDGNPKAKLVFVGEGPGHDEDMQGLPFVGRAGKLLTQMIEAMGLQRSDVYICNVVKCRPPDNRRPENDEVAACSPFLSRQIDTIAPKVIVCLGATAAQTVLSTTDGISQFRGEWREFRGRKLMATYHPAYLLRNPAAKSEVWKDLQKVMIELGLEVKKTKPS